MCPSGATCCARARSSGRGGELSWRRRAVAGRAAVRRCGRAAGTGAPVRRPCRGHRDGGRAVSASSGSSPRRAPSPAAGRSARPSGSAASWGRAMSSHGSLRHGGRAVADDGPPDRGRVGRGSSGPSASTARPVDGSWRRIEWFRRIVGTLVRPASRTRISRRYAAGGPRDWGAYDLWLRGWSALRRPDLGVDRRGPAVLPAGADQGLPICPRLSRPGHGASQRVGVLCLEPLVLPAPGGSRPGARRR